MENILLGTNIVSVPEELCENIAIYREVLSLNTFDTLLTPETKQHLLNLLPNFPDSDDESEKLETLRRLFAGENFKFGNQSTKLFKKMNEGLLAPPVARLGRSLKKAAFREYKMKQKRYFCQLLQPLLVSRKLLLESAMRSSPEGQIGRVYPEEVKEVKDHVEERTRWRYFTELQEVREECGEVCTSSEDENFPGPPPKLSRKHKKHLQFLETSLGPDMHRILPTTATPTKQGHVPISASLAMLELTEERYRRMLQEHQLRRSQGDLHPELDTCKITLEGVMQRAAVSRRTSSKSDSSKKKWKGYEDKKHKKPSSGGVSTATATITNIPKPSISPIPNAANQDCDVASTPIQPPSTPITTPIKETAEQIAPPHIAPPPPPPHPLLLPPLSSIDPPSEEMEVDVGSDVEGHLVISNIATITNTTPHSRRASVEVEKPSIASAPAVPTSFFALLRDIFYELPEQKMSVARLEERVRVWMENPVLGCDWLSVFDPWVDLVQSALKFLAGDLLGIQPDNFVPYLDYREKQQQWQWIGAGRDTDDHLNPLCQHWLDNKDDLSLEALEACQGSPPPARVATDWTVKATNEDEKQLYRQQECIRYQNPHLAYTFRVHGYESVVGPVKGVYGKESGVNKAREHSLLISDRPPFVTILSLVRDSAARLPNGEGTRADICELLKDSQYLATASDQQIHTVVSGALDRLHYEKDPCVKYDTNRKLWIYLHRHRTEEEFEKIHQAQAAAAKAKKAMQQKTKPPRSNKPKETTPRWSPAMGAYIDPATPTSVGGAKGNEAIIIASDICTQISSSPIRSTMTKATQSAKGSQASRRLSTTNNTPMLSPPPLGIFSSVTQQQKPMDTGESAIITSIATSIAVSNCTTQTSQPRVALMQPLMGQQCAVSAINTPMTATTPQIKTNKRGGSGQTVVGGVSTQPTLQGFQTIVIKQEGGKPAIIGSSNSQTISSLGTLGTLTTRPVNPGVNAKKNNNPMMARLVSGTQVVSLSNLMGGATFQQGTGYVRPNTSPSAATAAALNILQNASGVANRLPKFALVSPNVRPSTTTTFHHHPHGLPITTALLQQQVQQDNLLGISPTLKLVASNNPAVSAALSKVTFTSAGTNTTAAMVTMTTSGSIPSVLLPGGTNPAAVMIASHHPGGSGLKPSTQAYVMAGANPASLKALQGIKVIPVSQAVNALRGKGGQTPLLARIIATPLQQTQSNIPSLNTQHLTAHSNHHMPIATTAQLVTPISQSLIVQVHAPLMSQHVLNPVSIAQTVAMTTAPATSTLSNSPLDFHNLLDDDLNDL